MKGKVLIFNCGQNDYKNAEEAGYVHRTLEPGRIHVAVDILICTVREGKLSMLLSKRQSLPFAERWALPGRLMGLDESAEAAQRKLLYEMLPVGEAYMEQLYTFTALNRDPRGRVISMAYIVILPWERLRQAMGRPGCGMQCFAVSLDEHGLCLTASDGTVLTSGDLAFDHGEIIRTGVTRLRGKIDYTDVGFHFLNDMSAFSLGELQTIFEAVLGKSADSSNFRRWVRNRYEETGRIAQTAQAKQQGRGRPAALYRFIK